MPRPRLKKREESGKIRGEKRGSENGVISKKEGALRQGMTYAAGKNVQGNTGILCPFSSLLKRVCGQAGGLLDH